MSKSPNRSPKKKSSSVPPVSPLRQQMIQAMEEAGFTQNTQDTYLRSVEQFVQHVKKPLQQAEEYDLIQYFTRLKEHTPAGTFRSKRWGLVFLFSNVLNRDWPSLREHRHKKRRPAKVHDRSLLDGAVDHPSKAKFRRDMELAGLSPCSRQGYLEAVSLFFKRTWLDPDKVAESNVEEYLLLLQRFHISPGSFKRHRFGLQFFCQTTLGHDWRLFEKKCACPGKATFPTRATTKSA